MAEFILRAQEKGAELKVTTDTIMGPISTLRFRYLQRGERFASLQDLPDSAILIPSVIRSLCQQLGLPPEEFGLTLDA